MHQYMQGVSQLESDVAAKALGVLADTKLNMSQQCAFAEKTVNIILGCTRQILPAGRRRRSFPFIQHW